MQGKNAGRSAQNNGNIFVQNLDKKCLIKRCGVWYNGSSTSDQPGSRPGSPTGHIEKSKQKRKGLMPFSMLNIY